MTERDDAIVAAQARAVDAYWKFDAECRRVYPTGNWPNVSVDGFPETFRWVKDTVAATRKASEAAGFAAVVGEFPASADLDNLIELGSQAERAQAELDALVEAI